MLWSAGHTSRSIIVLRFTGSLCGLSSFNISVAINKHLQHTHTHRERASFSYRMYCLSLSLSYLERVSGSLRMSRSERLAIVRCASSDSSVVDWEQEAGSCC